jgi:EmrB/QacA subfamily drug resistance transporter
LSATATPAALDPRRWVTLAVVVVSALITVLDNSVLTVAIPTMLRDLDTTLPALEWVITGYALVFASCLIISGRLGDVFGHRRMFIIGCTLFSVGSLLAALSWNVPSLIVGEAVIEGVGASLMLPATLAIISLTFQGRERASAFGAWGGTIGVGVALGPVLGGFLTTNYSWRWAFGINVIVAPLAILGALLFIPRDEPGDRRIRIDLPGACLVASGLFLFVFALSEGPRYGWFRALEPFSLGGAQLLPRSLELSVVPVALVVSIVILFFFYRVERRKERLALDPLFEFGQLRHRGFRYGLITSSVLSMGQMGMFFVLPVFLQDAKHLSAETNGLWMAPFGICIIIGSQLGGYMTRHMAVARVVQLGLVLELLGLVFVALVVAPDMTFVDLIIPYGLFGFGIGFASSQLTNVVLSDMPLDKSGVASGANATMRQVGAAFGVAVIGSIFASQTITRAIDALRDASISSGLRADAVAGVHSQGASFLPPKGTPAADAVAVSHALATGITDAVRPALFVAAGCVVVGVLFSLLLPRVPNAEPEPLVEALVALEPVEPDPAEVTSARETMAPVRFDHP